MRSLSQDQPIDSFEQSVATGGTWKSLQLGSNCAVHAEEQLQGREDNASAEDFLQGRQYY